MIPGSQSGDRAVRGTAPAVAVAVTGAVLVLGLAAFYGMSVRDAAGLAIAASAPAAVVGVLGGAALLVAGRRSIGFQATLIALTSVGAVAAGTFAAAAGRYVSSTDLHTHALVLVAGGTIGVVTALLLGRRITMASLLLGAAARRIGDGSGPSPPTPAPGELAVLARELESTSARLEEARAKEQALDASRRELVAWVSHDLRTPLAGIRAIAEALEDRVVDDPDTVGRYHRTLRLEADRLAGLVDDLFELSRIQAGALRLEMEEASLGDLVSDALAAADPVARAKGVRLEGHLGGAPPDLVLSTPEVSRVLRNLLENAIRHTPSDGTIWVEAGVEDDAAYVSVADGCGGIDGDVIGRVFDLAFRGERARTPGVARISDGGAPGGGAGLGLAIAKGLVEAHHGDIEVVNEGPGCRFTVRIPLSSPPSAPGSRRAPDVGARAPHS
ncbi:MAG: sensor histidine kinase [Acidimicrobiales bacterium]